MCGIAGAITADGSAPDRSRLERMADALAHRGPDGSGMHVSGAVGLVHRRLAIIDLETGDQPLFSGGEGEEPLALVANGEIYNYRELAAEMPGVRLRTGSDCEPPLHLYRREGIEGFDRLRGMYAIALVDPAACPGGRLVLVRDPFGIKPLYYVEDESGFAFASEPAALVAGGYAKAVVNDRAIAEILQLQFSTGAATPFSAIRRVAPGETLVIEGGRIIERRHRPALPSSSVAPTPAVGRSWDDALDAFDRLFEETVDLHQRSDVPYGMFFSGGIDSTALLIMMSRLNDRPVHTFTAGFPGTRVHDERAHAHMIADRLGAETTDVTLDENDFMRLLPRVAGALDDPVADYAILPTFRLAEIAGAAFKVILSGEGGDELFGGYGRYRRAMRPRLFGGRPMRHKGTFDGLDVLRKDAGGWRDGIQAAETEVQAQGGSRLQQLQAVDCHDWLPQRPAHQAGSLPDGQWHRGANAIPRPGIGRLCLSAA